MKQKSACWETNRAKEVAKSAATKHNEMKKGEVKSFEF